MIRGHRRNEDRKTVKRQAVSQAKAAARKEAKMSAYKGRVSQIDPTKPPA
jgi:hypothetical protein